MSKNKLLKGVKESTNFTLTENGAVTHKSTLDGLYDLFALGAAYRSRSEDDCIVLFQKAFEENPTYALKCLFYLRDAREGQGERRFFRAVTKWLATNETKAMKRNLRHIPEFGRWDDLYAFVGTPLEIDAFAFMKAQFILDVQCETPSLLAKWLKSENTSSAESRELAKKTREAFGLSPRLYRKGLSLLRKRINVLERLMSAGEWDKIEFDKVSSRAGLIYRNAFARHDLERLRADKNAVAYKDFVQDENTTVNAGVLYPYEVVSRAAKYVGVGWRRPLYTEGDVTERAAINKYWDNLKDYFNEASLDALCVVDTSGSMWGTPIDVAISLGLYAAERARGPFHGNYITFASRPQLIETRGVDFVDKVRRIYEANLCDNTNIEAVFDLLLNTALRTNCRQSDLPKTIVIISDMEFDYARGYWCEHDDSTLMEGISHKWERTGYQMPELVFWNVDARQDNIPMKVENGITFCSGFSPVLFEQIMKGKTGYDLMMDKLNSARYECIR